MKRVRRLISVCALVGLAIQGCLTGAMAAEGERTAPTTLHSLSVRVGRGVWSAGGQTFTIDFSGGPSGAPPNGEFWPTLDPEDLSHTTDFALSAPFFPEPLIGGIWLDFAAISDVDQNGILDGFDPEFAVEGVVTEGDYVTDVDAGIVTARWDRAAGEVRGTCVITLESDTFGHLGDFAAPFELTMYRGSLFYGGEEGVPPRLEVSRVDNAEAALSGPVRVRSGPNGATLEAAVGTLVSETGATLAHDAVLLGPVEGREDAYLGLWLFEDGDPATEYPDFYEWAWIIEQAVDEDGDGVPDLAEETTGVAGLRLEIRLADDEVELMVHGEPGETYALEEAAELGADQWTGIRTIEMTGSTATVTLPKPGAVRFWRLRR